jgi:hypothetical protein
MKEIDRLAEDASKQKMASLDESMVAKKLHFGLGRWISYNWQFEDGSRYTHYLKSLDLYYTDDMIDFTLMAYHRHLLHKKIDAPQLAKIFVSKREKEKLELAKKGEVISVKKRQ